MKKYISLAFRIFAINFCISSACLAADDSRGVSAVGPEQCRESLGNVGAEFASRPSKPDERIYVLDTNALIRRPELLNTLAGQHVAVPDTVVAELDALKQKLQGPDAQRLRTVSRELTRLMGNQPRRLVPRSEGGMLHFISPSDGVYGDALDRSVPDDQIISVANRLKREGWATVVVTDDNLARLKAGIQGHFIDESKTVVAGGTSEDRSGVDQGTLGTPLTVRISRDRLEELNRLDTISADQFDRFGIPKGTVFYDNQFVVFENLEGKASFDFDTYLNTRLWRYCSSGTQGVPFLRHPQKREIRAQAIRPRNLEQLMALDLLLDPRLSLVTLMGKAGSGKTLMAITAMMGQSSILKNRGGRTFDRVLLIRPNVEASRGHGFIRGSMVEKLRPLFGAFEDNFPVWIDAHRLQQQHAHGTRREFGDSVGHKIVEARSAESKSRRKSGKPRSSAGPGNDLPDGLYELTERDLSSPLVSPERLAEKMLNSTYITMQALSLVRGRSIRDTLVVVDEAQNLTDEELLLIATRMDEGSLLVLVGDPGQIDLQGYSRKRNALFRAATSFQGKPYAGYIILPKGERSALASDAADLLDTGR